MTPFEIIVALNLTMINFWIFVLSGTILKVVTNNIERR